MKSLSYSEILLNSPLATMVQSMFPGYSAVRTVGEQLVRKAAEDRKKPSFPQLTAWELD